MSRATFLTNRGARNEVFIAGSFSGCFSPPRRPLSRPRKPSRRKCHRKPSDEVVIHSFVALPCLLCLCVPRTIFSTQPLLAGRKREGTRVSSYSGRRSISISTSATNTSVSVDNLASPHVTRVVYLRVCVPCIPPVSRGPIKKVKRHDGHSRRRA